MIPPIIPRPAVVVERSGAAFHLCRGTPVLLTGPGADREAVAVLSAGMLGVPVAVFAGGDVPPAPRPGAVAALSADPAGAPAVLVHLREPSRPADAALDEVSASGEAYAVDVTGGALRIDAASAAGLRHALTTLGQLARPHQDGITLPAVHLLDRPRYPWRGLSVDVARHAIALPTLHRLLDLMAGYKLNVLHLHLTDDQGWRLELATRPLLTARSGTTQVGTEPGTFYTAADYAELVAAAARRGIVVVPEIDVPGHVNAALHAYGELTPDGQAPPSYHGIEVGFSRLHLDLPATRPFLADVFGELAALTPGPYLHLGGDEVLTMAHREYAGFVREVCALITAAGKTPMGWQEVAGAELPPGSVVQLWDTRAGLDAVVDAARAGAAVVLSPAPRVYLDLKYDADTPIGLDWAGTVEVRDSYDWDPDGLVPCLPPAAVAGVEAAVWTETIATEDELMFMLLPRLAAVAEVAWSQQDRRDWAGFRHRLACHARRWEAAGLAYHRSPQVPWPATRS